MVHRQSTHIVLLMHLDADGPLHMAFGQSSECLPLAAFSSRCLCCLIVTSLFQINLARVRMGALRLAAAADNITQGLRRHDLPPTRTEFGSLLREVSQKQCDLSISARCGCPRDREPTIIKQRVSKIYPPLKGTSLRHAGMSLGRLQHVLDTLHGQAVMCTVMTKQSRANLQTSR